MRLRRKIDLVIPEMVGASRGLVEHPLVSDLYAEYLRMCLGIVQATTPLMEAALSKARAAPHDPGSNILAAYLERHVAEEAGEDEWLLADLEVLGWDRATVLARPPSPTVAALVGAQYYWIRHSDPVALLGYLAALEGYSPSHELIDELISKTGHSRDAFRTLTAHAELDPGHRAELDELIDHLPLTSEQSALISQSAMSSAHLLARAVGEVVEDA